MEILFLAPLTRKITPQITAARPRLIFDLISELKKRGHKITVLGTGDTKIPGVKVIPVIKKGFYELDGSFENPFYAHTSFLIKQMKMAQKLSSKFGLIHNHCYPEFISLFLEKNIKTPMVTTLHMVMTPELDEVLSLFPESKIISPAMAKKLAKKTKIYKTINPGVDTNLYKFEPKKENYLLWVGRLGKAKDKNKNFIDPKGVRWAISLAKATGLNLKLVANVEDMDFFNKEVKPHLSNKIKWIGKVSSEQPLNKKQIVRIMQKAKVLLMLSESFGGLVTREALSCGTPVIGFPKKTYSKIVINGKTGFLVPRKKGLNGLKKAVEDINKIKPADCRKHIEKNFGLEKMADEYEKIYREVLKN
jgi:glycosyltransferase involved in cell wall biosynthesis